jgi:DNA-binding transcriptional LysR family regulator
MFREPVRHESRLRKAEDMFGDVLLVRSGREYQRTVRGERVLREVESVLPRIEAMVRGESFDPALSRDRFRVAMTDHASMVLMPPLMERIRTTAVNMTIETLSWRDGAYDDVTAGRLDTALSAEAAPPQLEAEVLYKEDFVCLVGSAQRLHPRRFTLEQYLKLPHALVKTLDGQQTLVDRPLAQLGLKRQVSLSIPFFVPTIFAIARTDLIVTVPRRLAKFISAIANLRVVEPPREIKGFPYFMVWHPRTAT